MFVVKVYCKIETSPWALTLTEPVPEALLRGPCNGNFHAVESFRSRATNLDIENVSLALYTRQCQQIKVWKVKVMYRVSYQQHKVTIPWKDPP